MIIFRSLSGSEYSFTTGVHERSLSKCSPDTLLLNVLCCGLGDWRASKGIHWFRRGCITNGKEEKTGVIYCSREMSKKG